MKKILFIAIAAAGLFASCDHVENPYPEAAAQGTWGLYPDGDSAHYYQNVYQTFTANTNTDRNVLIEDFTGHKCLFCPAAAAEAESIKGANPGRVFVSGVHTSPIGEGSFQEFGVAPFLHDFTCTEGLTIGQAFGLDWPGSPFIGNPYGSISRADNGGGFPVEHPSTWSASTTSLLTTNDLKVNLQAQVNYYTSTRGLFLHIEADVLDQALMNELKLVVHLSEDTIVQPQLLAPGSGFPNDIDDNYVHRDVLRGSIDGSTWGQTLDAAHLDANGKYYYDYIYELPAGYDPENMSLLMYVRDAVTEEIYQVIEKHVQ